MLGSEARDGRNDGSEGNQGNDVEGMDRWSVGGGQGGYDGSVGFSEQSVDASPMMLTEECYDLNIDVLHKKINDTGVEYEMREKEHKWRDQKIMTKKGKLETWKGPWMVRRMWEQKEEVAIQSLKQWTHKRERMKRLQKQ